jgi:hypothetical protein
MVTLLRLPRRKETNRCACAVSRRPGRPGGDLHLPVRCNRPVLYAILYIAGIRLYGGRITK